MEGINNSLPQSLDQSAHIVIALNSDVDVSVHHSLLLLLRYAQGSDKTLTVLTDNPGSLRNLVTGNDINIVNRLEGEMMMIELDYSNSDISNISWDRDQDRKTITFKITGNGRLPDSSDVSVKNSYGSENPTLVVLGDSSLEGLRTLYEDNRDALEGIVDRFFIYESDEVSEAVNFINISNSTTYLYEVLNVLSQSDRFRAADYKEILFRDFNPLEDEMDEETLIMLTTYISKGGLWSDLVQGTKNETAGSASVKNVIERDKQDILILSELHRNLRFKDAKGYTTTYVGRGFFQRNEIDTSGLVMPLIGQISGFPVSITVVEKGDSGIEVIYQKNPDQQDGLMEPAQFAELFDATATTDVGEIRFLVENASAKGFLKRLSDVM